VLQFFIIYYSLFYFFFKNWIDPYRNFSGVEPTLASNGCIPFTLDGPAEIPVAEILEGFYWPTMPTVIGIFGLRLVL